MATNAELLVAIDSAIMNTLTREAAELMYEDRTIKSFSLPELFRIRTKLIGLVAHDSGGRRSSVVSFGSPS